MRRWASDSSGGEQDGQGRRQEPGGRSGAKKAQTGQFSVEEAHSIAQRGSIEGSAASTDLSPCDRGNRGQQGKEKESRSSLWRVGELR
jgi:hypothetical protein